MNIEADLQIAAVRRPPEDEPPYWEAPADSSYESWKAELAGSLLDGRSCRAALLVGDAAGELADRVGELSDHVVVIDGGCSTDWRIEGEFDLIVCDHVLDAAPADGLDALAARLARHLRVGGHLLLAHENSLADDPTRTGFDRGATFGAVAIAAAAGRVRGLLLVRELRSPLFTAHLFRRDTRPKRAVTPELIELPLPDEIALPLAVERRVVWNGALMTRARAEAEELCRDVPILMYHSVADEGPEACEPYRTSVAAFREQIRYLRRNGYHTITLGEWRDAIDRARPLAGRPIIITFDDGYRDFHRNALPILERSDFGATVFVVTEKVGSFADWEEETASIPLMDWDEIRDAVARGTIIGSHTARHADMLRVPRARFREECRISNLRLREKLGIEARDLAYPWGCSYPRGRALLADYGFRTAVRSWGGRSTLEDDPSNLARIEIGADTLEEFIEKLKSPYLADHNDYPAPDGWEESEPVGFADKPDDAMIGFGDGAGTDPVGFMVPSAQRQDEPVGFSPRVPAVAVPSALVTVAAPQPPARMVAGVDSSARLEQLIDELVRLRDSMIEKTGARMTLQKRVAGLFSSPLTGRTGRDLRSLEPIAHGVSISFDEGAHVALRIDPKDDHSRSPESYLNKLGIFYTGESHWLALEAYIDWSELSLIQRFQLGICAQADREVFCKAILRLQKRGGKTEELVLTSFDLGRDDRTVTMAGTVTLPDLVDIDTGSGAHLMLFFDTTADLSLVIHYLNVYVA